MLENQRIKAAARPSRREFERHPLDAEVEFVYPQDASGITINVSAGGMRVALDRGVEVGTTCIAVVRTASRREVVEHARVVWSQQKPDGWVLGLQFVVSQPV